MISYSIGKPVLTLDLSISIGKTVLPETKVSFYPQEVVLTAPLREVVQAAFENHVGFS